MDAGTRQLLLTKQVLALCADHEGGDEAGVAELPSSSKGKGKGKRERNSVGFYKTPGGGGNGGAVAGVGVGGAGALPAIDLARMWARVGKRLVEDEEVRACVPACGGRSFRGRLSSKEFELGEGSVDRFDWTG
jgi:hypothetical protein